MISGSRLFKLNNFPSCGFWLLGERTLMGGDWCLSFKNHLARSFIWRLLPLRVIHFYTNSVKLFLHFPNADAPCLHGLPMEINSFFLRHMNLFSQLKICRTCSKLENILERLLSSLIVKFNFASSDEQNISQNSLKVHQKCFPIKVITEKAKSIA